MFGYSILASGGAASGTIGNFIGSMQKTLANYGAVLVSIIGLAMVIVAVYQIAKNLMSGGKGQTNWITTIALLIIGGALAISGGWGTLGTIAKTGNGTIQSFATGSADMTAGSHASSNPFSEKIGN